MEDPFGFFDDKYAEKMKKQEEVLDFMRNNPNKTIKEMLDETNLKVERTDVDMDENYIKISFGEGGYMSLRFNYVNVDENNFRRLLDGLLNNKCGDLS